MKQIISDRRALHRMPELELYLPETMEYLTSALAGLKCRVFSPMESSLCAFFDFGAERSIAFRADCDGLPMRKIRVSPSRLSTPAGCTPAAKTATWPSCWNWPGGWIKSTG